MTTLRENAIVTRIEDYQRRIAQLEVQLDAVERFGDDDDYEVGCVLTFGKQFRPGGLVYSYAALKTPVGWYVTGKNTTGWGWATLVEFMTEGVDEVLMVTEVEAL